MKEKFWTYERDQIVLKLHAEGKNKKEIAAAVGVTPNAINGRFFRLGLTKANKRRRASHDDSQATPPA